MPQNYQYLIHAESRALWPQHKPLAEVLELQATTPELVFAGTYQGEPTPEGGVVFLRDWWASGDRRYTLGADEGGNPIVGRWVSVDTALKDKDESDYTALVVVELLANYLLRVRDVVRRKLTFPDLPSTIASIATQYNHDGLLRGVIVEDRQSGTSAIQTLQQSADLAIRQLIIPFVPTTSKQERARQGALWCKQGCILLPRPHGDATWLNDFEIELFSFPSGEHDDQVDAFSQILLWLEHVLSEGYRARHGYL